MKTQTLDMRLIRYLNLFGKITGVNCKNCFSYNNLLFFAVPSALISRAIGKQGQNVKRISQLLHKKIKIVSLPRNIEDVERFVSYIVEPNRFRRLEVSQDEIIISSNKQEKAALIGRNKTRLLELQKIVQEYFGKRLRIA